MSNNEIKDNDKIYKVKHLLKTLSVQLSAEPSLKKQVDVVQMKKSLSDVLGSLMQLADELGIKRDEVFQRVRESLSKKKQLERFQKYSNELIEFLTSSFKVISGTPQEMLQQLAEIVAHAEGLWSDAVHLFEQERFATACFLALVCIEECAKISFGELQFYDRSLHSSASTDEHSRGKNPLTSHTRKHFLAACSGALVNSRMDRILGMDNVNSFIEDCETGRLEIFRQACLYADISDSGITVVPESLITKEQSHFYICLAGELLAEIEGTEAIRGQFLKRLSKFESGSK